MIVTVVIAVVGLLAAVAAVVWSLNSHSDLDPIDPEVEKRWLVRNLAARPRLAHFVKRRLDPTKAGGLFLTVGVAIVFGLTLFAGWVFDTLEESRGFAQFDEAVAKWGAANATPTSTRILNLITDLGGTGFIVFVTIVIAAYGWYRHRNVHVVFFVLAVVAGQALVNNGLKLLIERDRPSLSQLAGWAGTSFPSGHSAAAAATYAAIALVLSIGASKTVRAWLAGGAFLIAAAVAATRALLGVHWLTDILAGLAVGWSWFLVCAVAFGGRLMEFGEPVREVPDTPAVREAAATRN